MELADVTDSKSVDGDIVWVRVPPPAPNTKKMGLPIFLCFNDEEGSSPSKMQSILDRLAL